jgi:diacylglycerol kinase family enzyme
VVSASTIALGYPAEAASMAGRRFRRFGRLSYAMAAACVVPTFRQMRLSYSGEKTTEKRVTGFLASNTCHAANFVAFPDACCDDGSFEAMELAAGFAGQGLHTLSTLSRLHFHGPPARANLTRASVACEEPGELLVDGELYADVVSVELQVLPAALACASNRGAT